MREPTCSAARSPQHSEPGRCGNEQFWRSLICSGIVRDSLDHGPDALEVAPLFQPHVVFLDLYTPELDGWEVCEQLRRSENVEGAAIFALTSYASGEYAARCRRARFDAYLVKPVELDLAGRLVQCSSP